MLKRITSIFSYLVRSPARTTPAPPHAQGKSHGTFLCNADSLWTAAGSILLPEPSAAHYQRGRCQQLPAARGGSRWCVPLDSLALPPDDCARPRVLADGDDKPHSCMRCGCAPTVEELSNAVLNSLQAARASGSVADPDQLKSVSQMFVELGLDKLFFYQENIEQPYLTQVRYVTPPPPGGVFSSRHCLRSPLIVESGILNTTGLSSGARRRDFRKSRPHS